MIKKLATIGAAAALFASSALPVLAAKPVVPNCLGTDVSGFAEVFQPLGQNVVKDLTGGGFGDEVLDHLQGVLVSSSCPLDGFPTP